eukprot:12146869-Ditylum_brightwellii.AAC.1
MGPDEIRSTCITTDLRGTSLINSLSGGISLVAVDRAIYLASVVMSDISVYNLLNHVMGQFVNTMMHPEQELTLFGSSLL